MPNILGELRAEILFLIFDILIETASSTTAKALSLVNRHFYATYRLVRHRHKSIFYGGRIDCPRTDLKPWLEDDELLRSVRSITISRLGYHTDVKPDQGRESIESARYCDLVKLLGKLGFLRSLIWSTPDPIPASVLDALHGYHPKAELSVTKWVRWEDSKDHTDSSETALATSPALKSLRATIWDYGSGARPDLRETAVKRIIANAPNLRNATIIKGASGCRITWPDPDEILEVRELAKLFFTHKRPNNALRSLTLDGFEISEETLRDWAEFVDLSNIESLKCSRGLPSASYFEYAPSVLTSLKHVSLNLAYYHDDDAAKSIEKYITTCAPLESLSLWSWQGVIPLSCILDSHGFSLKLLQLHEKETIDSRQDERRRLLTAVQVVEIASSCPNLRDFTFDLHRHTRELQSEINDDAEIFDTLTKMNLDRLQIYYDLGLPALAGFRAPALGNPLEEDDGAPVENRDHDPPAEPLAPSSNDQIYCYATCLWKRLFGRSRKGGRRLDLKFGEWERKLTPGYPAYWVMKEQELRTFWTAQPKERDDQQDQCDVIRQG